VPWVQRMAPYTPPEDLDALARRTGRTVDDIVKLDANENPYGCSLRVADALARYQHFHWYTDPDQKVLREAVAAYAGVPPDTIVLGNGSDELIDLLCRTFLRPGDEIIDCTPTFGMYRFSAELCGAIPIDVPRTEDWHVDVDGVRAAISPRTRMIFVASPNNPTGTWEPTETVQALQDLGPVLVLDEAYVEFSAHRSRVSLVEAGQNLVVLRTFSKWAGLAGLRVGYGVFPREIVSTLMKIKPPFNVNRAAEIAVLATLEDVEAVNATVTAIIEERDRMARALGRIEGIRSWPSEGNFVLVEAADGSPRRLYDHLVSRGILVRTYAHGRLTHAVRISAGRPEHTNALVAAVDEWSEMRGTHD